MDAYFRLSNAFFARVKTDPVLRPLYPNSVRCATEAIAYFLTQFLGGPCKYSEQRWSLSLKEAHLRFQIGPRERDAWLKNMSLALDDVQVERDLKRELEWFFQRSSAFLIDEQSPPAEHEIDTLWDEHLALENCVAAVRAGNVEAAISLTEGLRAQLYFQRDPAAFLSLLALMSGVSQFEDYVKRELLKNPALVHDRYTYGRSLLHDVSATRCLPVVQLLLELGADPNTTDRFGHTPLYSLGNSMEEAGGADVVRALTSGGANVNLKDRVKRCTPLHMAARRGNVAVAGALLDCGADIEARDIAEETPLRRAVNCGKTNVAALLLARGADRNSIGTRGLTPRQAARTAAMKQLFV